MTLGLMEFPLMTIALMEFPQTIFDTIGVVETTLVAATFDQIIIVLIAFVSIQFISETFSIKQNFLLYQNFMGQILFEQNSLRHKKINGAKHFLNFHFIQRAQLKR
jgi:hypothetical protein